MPTHHCARYFALMVLLLKTGPALAYVGPGAGLSAIGSILAFLGVIVLMIIGFFWYPLKRVYVRLRKHPPEAETEETKEAEPLDAK